MELVYILALEVFAVIAVFKIFTGWAAVSVIILSLLGIWLFTKRKNLLIYAVPLFLMLRIIFIIHTGESNRLEVLKMEIEMNKGRGRILKIDGKYPEKRSFTFISELGNGHYNILGEVIEVEHKKFANIFTINKITETKIEKNSIEKYFDKKVKAFTAEGDSSFRRIYKAVVLGEGNQIPKELRDKFNYTGVSHLMALSGLHIGIILGTAGFILKKFPLKKEIRNILILILLTLYFIGVKHSPSLTRAYIMGVIFILGKLFYENTDLVKSLTVSFILMVFFNPTAVDEISFKLSYLAVFAIAAIYPVILKKVYKGESKIIKNLILAFAIQIFLAPIIMEEFGNIQFLSFFTNLIILPLGTLYITSAFVGLILSNIGLEFLAFPVVNILFKIFINSVEFFSQIPYLNLEYKGNRDSILFLLFYVIISGIMFYKKIKTDGKKNETIYKRTKILK